jgi:hypothetical protein
MFSQAPATRSFSKLFRFSDGTARGLWVVFISILFVLPQVRPVTIDNFNYASVTVGAVLLFAGGWWILSAHRWFKGPVVQGTPQQLAAIERELGAV